MRHNQTGVINQFSSFGIPFVGAVYGVIGKDDKITFPGYMPGFREASELLNLLYLRSSWIKSPSPRTQWLG
ncbi:MAG: DUF2608 domain-containing protein [Clostridiales bacterium]|nr:DUF2608 domain-containing protein [Clostridiales bacterium]